MHIFIIVNGVETPTDEGHEEGGDRVASLQTQFPENVVRTYIVCETPERMEDFEKLVDKFCKKG